MVIDAVSLGMLHLARVVVFMGCQIQSFCSTDTFIAFHCLSLLLCFNRKPIDTINARQLIFKHFLPINL